MRRQPAKPKEEHGEERLNAAASTPAGRQLWLAENRVRSFFESQGPCWKRAVLCQGKRAEIWWDTVTRLWWEVLRSPSSGTGDTEDTRRLSSSPTGSPLQWKPQFPEGKWTMSSCHLPARPHHGVRASLQASSPTACSVTPPAASVAPQRVKS